MSKTIYAENQSKNQLQVEREFHGGLELVWKAWTDATILAEWWAPLPYKAVTRTMDFREGGHWHYYMLGPNGEIHWCLINYINISLLKSFTGDDLFCDEHRTPNPELPVMHWEVLFNAAGASTRVTVNVTFKNKEDMQKIVEMGFKEGFAMAHDNLDKWLAAQ